MKRKSLTVFMLAMINVAAIGSIKNWPTTAVFGFSSLFFFLLAALIFFIPTAMVSAELATGWPKLGGVFVWIKEAFGHRTGFLAVWLLWVLNVIWYPTMAAFIAGTFAYIVNPALADNPLYYLILMLVIFWAATLLNFKDMRLSGWVSTAGALGTFIPGALIIALGLAWYFSGKPLNITLSWDGFFPNLSSPEQLVFFTGVMLSLTGIEMSAVHAKDVRNPQKDYPKAIWISGLIIFGSSILGVLAIAAVIPEKEISLSAGVMQALSRFLTAYGLTALTPLIGLLVIISAIGSLSTWIIGPARGLLAAAQSGDLPPFFRRVNKHQMPVPLLLVQGCIVSLLSLAFVLMPSINSAYWILTVMVAEVYLIMYLLLFAAAIKLRYKRPDVPRAYRIKGGNAGIWAVCLTGSLGSLFALVIGFFPPVQVATGNTTLYVLFLIFGIGLICLLPQLILRFQKPSWKKLLSHEEPVAKLSAAKKSPF